MANTVNLGVIYRSKALGQRQQMARTYGASSQRVLSAEPEPEPSVARYILGPSINKFTKLGEITRTTQAHLVGLRIHHKIEMGESESTEVAIIFGMVWKDMQVFYVHTSYLPLHRYYI